MSWRAGQGLVSQAVYQMGIPHKRLRRAQMVSLPPHQSRAGPVRWLPGQPQGRPAGAERLRHVSHRRGPAEPPGCGRAATLMILSPVKTYRG